MTPEELLFKRFIGKSILLDANLLLTVLIGAFDRRLLLKFKRVSSYSTDDYELLVRFLGAFTVLVTTPHILTEVSNLATSLPEHIRRDWLRSFGAFLTSENQKPGIREHWSSGQQLASIPEFVAFGITDAGLKQLASEALLLTEDRRLAGVLNQQGIPTLNFGDLRSLAKGLRA
jgi:hypothetical protein